MQNQWKSDLYQPPITVRRLHDSKGNKSNPARLSIPLQVRDLESWQISALFEAVRFFPSLFFSLAQEDGYPSFVLISLSFYFYRRQAMIQRKLWFPLLEGERRNNTSLVCSVVECNERTRFCFTLNRVHRNTAFDQQCNSWKAIGAIGFELRLDEAIEK